jgi:hypothetical protein
MTYRDIGRGSAPKDEVGEDIAQTEYHSKRVHVRNLQKDISTPFPYNR